MELDDLKQTWKQAEKNQKLQNNNIMELIQQKGYGPIAALKSAFRKQVILTPILLALVIVNLSRHHELFTNIIFWCYVAFCFLLSIYFYFNYRIVSKMECMDCLVKSNLERQIEMLGKRLRWHIAGVRIGVIFFIVLSEVLTFFQHEPMLEKWHSVSPVIRLSSYVAFLIFQHFVSRLISQRKYGRHLAYLKDLVNEMQ